MSFVHIRKNLQYLHKDHAFVKTPVPLVGGPAAFPVVLASYYELTERHCDAHRTNHHQSIQFESILDKKLMILFSNI